MAEYTDSCFDSARNPQPCLLAGGQLLVLGDGTLVDVFVEVPSPAPCTPTMVESCIPTGPTTLAATQFDNQSQTWSDPVTIEVDPFASAPVLPGAALAPDAGPNGTIHVTWQEFRSQATDPAPIGCTAGDPCITLTDYQSTDGVHWTRGTIGDSIRTRSERSAGACCLAAPAIAVADDGTIGVAFYDHRRDSNLSVDRKVTDYWFRHSHDGGLRWSENRVAGAFDHSQAAFPSIGEYQGIAPMPGGFATAYALAAPCRADAPCDDGAGGLTDANFELGTCAPDEINACQPTDIFFSRVRVIPNGYARPLSASPASIRLVSAYESCTDADGTHGAPLSSPSCNPPAQTSHYLTVGTPDANGKPALFAGRLELKVVGESPIDPSNGDQADVQITTSVTDVRNKSDLSDYTGELQAVLGLRITDRYNTPFLDDPATVTDTPFTFAIPCASTGGPEGGACNVTTTADALMTEMAREGQRAIWELSQVKVYDGGSDGDADTTGDNTLFAVQGAFAP